MVIEIQYGGNSAQPKVIRRGNIGEQYHSQENDSRWLENEEIEEQGHAPRNEVERRLREQGIFTR